MSSYSPSPKIESDQTCQGGAVNIKFLSPPVVMFATTLAFLLLLPILPVDVNVPLTEGAVFFWLISFSSFLGGTIFGAGGRFHMRVPSYHPNTKTVKKFLALLVIIGFIGTVLLLVDRYMIRGVLLMADALENREILSHTKPSLLSAIAAMGSSIGILSYMTIWVAELNQVAIRRWIKIVAALSVVTAILVSIQLGSRSLLLVILLSYLFGWFFILRMRGGGIKISHILIMLSLILAMAIVSSWLMVRRVEIMGFSMLESILTSAYAEMIVPSEFVLNAIQKDDNLTAFIAGLFSLVQYVFHGIYEFSLLYNNFDGEHEVGSRTLWLPLKVASVLTRGGIFVGDFDNSGIREGVFTTFVGPIFIDFGLMSPFILFLYGMLVGLPFRLLRMGRFEWLPAVTLAATSAVLWPVVNIFDSSSGTFLFVGAAAIGALGKCLRGN